MRTAATLVSEARTGASLTMRGLAARADVATSTVARIEAGRVDPTVSMLARLLSAAGCELELSVKRAPGPEIADLADAWSPGSRGDRPDWTRLRAFLDTLALHPERTGSATLRKPDPSGSAVQDTLLAGIAEKLCDDAGLPRPAWTRRIPAAPRTLGHTWHTRDAGGDSSRNSAPAGRARAERRRTQPLAGTVSRRCLTLR